MSQQMDMKMNFYRNLSPSVYETPARDKERSLMFTDEEYSNQIQMIKGIKQTVRKIGACESLFSYKLDVATVNGRDRLILHANDDSDSYTVYVPTSEMFDTIHEHHLATGHGVPRIPELYHVLNTNFANITEGAVGLYLKLCVTCSKRKYVDSKTTDPWSKFTCEDLAPKKSRGILDIIDMRNEKSKKYQYIMCYTVSSTNFVFLKPLKTTCEKEVASRLIDAFAVFGTPIILNSTVDSIEFNDRLINTLYEKWPDAKVVRGRPTEHITETVMKQKLKLHKLMQMWMWETHSNSSEWPNSLNWVQFRMNSNPDMSSMEFTPFEMMFGQSPFLGLSSAKIDNQNSSNYHYEEDISDILKYYAGGSTNIRNKEYSVKPNPLPADNDSGDQNSTVPSKILAANPVPIFKRPMDPVVARRSKKSDGEIATGTRVLISALQKCVLKLNPGTLLTTIVIECRGNLYMLGTEKGLINFKFHRKHLTPCNIDTSICVKRSKIISLHDAFGAKACPKGTRVAKCETAECICQMIERSCNYKSHESDKEKEGKTTVLEGRSKLSESKKEPTNTVKTNFGGGIKDKY
ncbi:Ribonuclease H-like domain [Cinara cedri]|uniref:Ribonuclease H-like domain n=1 Tax=Cinara cedri TaxID=506608 RepID=A0A5E4M6Q8_9HEMI|nr:Ribonuclease H-like domain [Cinara cedri]